MKFRWETPSSCMSLLSQGGCRYLSWLLYFWFTFALLFLSWLLYSTDIWFYDPYVIYISMILWITNMIVLILLICWIIFIHIPNSYFIVWQDKSQQIIHLSQYQYGGGRLWETYNLDQNPLNLQILSLKSFRTQWQYNWNTNKLVPQPPLSNTLGNPCLWKIISLSQH